MTEMLHYEQKTILSIYPGTLQIQQNAAIVFIESGLVPRL